MAWGTIEYWSRLVYLGLQHTKSEDWVWLVHFIPLYAVAHRCLVKCCIFSQEKPFRQILTEEKVAHKAMLLQRERVCATHLAQEETKRGGEDKLWNSGQHRNGKARSDIWSAWSYCSSTSIPTVIFEHDFLGMVLNALYMEAACHCYFLLNYNSILCLIVILQTLFVDKRSLRPLL